LKKYVYVDENKKEWPYSMPIECNATPCAVHPYA